MPFRMSVGLDAIYYIPHGELVQTWFKNSRGMSPRPIIIASEHAFGLPPKDMELMIYDDSGEDPKPAPGFEDINPDHRLFYHTLKDILSFTQGPALKILTPRFITNFTKRMQTTDSISKEGWTEIPDIFVWFRDHMFRSNIETLCGEYMISLSPNFVEEFWTYDRDLLLHLRRTPKWLAPRAHRDRQKVLQSIGRWQQNALNHFDYNDEALVNSDTDPYWGSQLFRARSIMMNNGRVSDEGKPALDLGLLWAANANVIPSAFWAFWGIHVSGPSVISRIRAETAPCFHPVTGELVDSPALYDSPLLNSAYLESLRYSATALPARKPVSANQKIGAWTIPEKDAMIIGVPWFAHHDTTFWNQGQSIPSAEKYEHSVDSFWVERFLQYPDDPTSGPILPTTNSTNPKKVLPKTHADDLKATVVTGPEIQGHFFPYGGGIRMCPGRFFAKQSLMAAIAVAMNEFEFEFGPDAVNAKPDVKFFPIGNLSPDRKIPGRIRRRVKQN